MGELNNKKWEQKRALLSSGLPLEHVVTSKLGERHFQIESEYAYTRLSEENIHKEFSVDLLAVRLIAQQVDSSTTVWSRLNLLIESLTLQKIYV